MSIFLINHGAEYSRVSVVFFCDVKILDVAGWIVAWFTWSEMFDLTAKSAQFCICCVKYLSGRL